MSPRESPLEAYRVDLERNPGRQDFGAADTLWLLVAHCLGRVSRADLDLRQQLGQTCAKALSEFFSSDAALSSGSCAESSSVQLIIHGLGDLVDRQHTEDLARGARGLAAHMCNVGAVACASTLLGFARQVAIGAGPVERGLLAVDQARACRQLGELESAEDLYEVAESIAERVSDRGLLARVQVGRGVIARVRGNYPQARGAFAQALQLAEGAGCEDVEMLAHQGLTVTAGVAGDFDTALRHGWRCFELSRGDVAKESESLTNLAQVCLEIGEPGAALQGFLSALERTDALRVRLPQLGGAAVSAARAGDFGILQAVAAAARREVARSELRYENAQLALSLAVAFAVAGNTAASEGFRSDARRIAKEGGYFELMHALQSEEFEKRVRAGRASIAIDSDSTQVVRAVAAFHSDPRALQLA